ncbi:pyruvate dehydrogenase (acetyl-transferring) E1 component subunit alpha [Bermanella sp. R86510]|uniref:pyruvate dehydrogenase (acetyl-transferring) E1 component subunit alpha n=1 Tax=unclassified Bermanella TaxID=2627862 RepID=UPI0037C77942
MRANIQSISPQGHEPLINFQIDYIQFLTKDGEWKHQRPDFATDEWLVDTYKHMAMTRTFDQKAIALQRTGQMGTYPSSLGQEAFAVAIGKALQEDDVFVPYYRDHGTLLMRGHDMTDLLAYWGGDERGSTSGPKQDFPACVPIATQITHAAGAAAAFKIRGQDNMVIATIGDGGTSKGDFFESLNVAGAWQLPLVVVVNNNQYAISVPREIQCGAQTLAQKAIGAGIYGVQVDGNDPVAMYQALSEARQRAKQHKGATLIEAMSYRLSDHTTADDASRYRPADEVKKAWEKDPVKRLQTLLASLNLWDSEKEQAWQKRCADAVDKAVKGYLELPPQPATSMFDYLYEQWPNVMNEQLDLLLDKVDRMS